MPRFFFPAPAAADPEDDGPDDPDNQDAANNQPNNQDAPMADADGAVFEVPAAEGAARAIAAGARRAQVRNPLQPRRRRRVTREAIQGIKTDAARAVDG